MKLLRHCLIWGGIPLIMASCSQETPWGSGTDSGEGGINVRLTALTDVKAAVPSVRAENGELVPPPAEEFQIRLTKNDGSYTKSWSSLEEFAKEESFSVGDYQLSAFYGSETSQGIAGNKGYETAYYYGSQDVTVREGQTSEVQLQPSLANAVLVIEYTDAFKNYFPYYSTTVQTEGHDAVNLGNLDGAYNYVVPGNLDITIEAQLQNGNRVHLTPASFPTEAKHMYKLRFTVYDGEIGKADQLGISFDESLTTDEVRVDLSDDVLNGVAPVVAASGFTSGDVMDVQKNVDFKRDLKFNVVARGGMKTAKLTIESDTYSPAYLTNGVVDLCSLDDAKRSEMEAAGIVMRGFREPEGEMANLDLTGLVANLPDGVHKFSLAVTDKHTNSSEPVDVTVRLYELHMSMEANGEAPFGEGYAVVAVTYDGPDPTDPANTQFYFSAENNYGSYDDCEVLSVTAENPTRVFEKKRYIYKVSVPFVDKDVFNVRAYWGLSGMAPDMEAPVAFSYPDYKVQLDPMSRKLRLKVDFDDPKKQDLFFRKIHVFMNGKKVDESDREKFSRDEPTHFIAIYKLNPEADYYVQTTLQSAAEPTKWGSNDNVIMEAAEPVPNGDFSQLKDKVSVTLNAGGKYRVSPVDYQHKCPISYQEAESWATLNAKTFFDNGDANNNTWFRVPSVTVRNGSAEIRTVAYSNKGGSIERSGTAFNTKYYCENAPSTSDMVYAPGELFLGTYGYSWNTSMANGEGTETRVYGVPFNSRPTSFTFDYTYIPYDAPDRAQVKVEILAADGSVLSEREAYLYSKESTEKYTIIMPRYYNFGVKAASLRIRFVSSTQATNWVYFRKNTELNEGQGLGNKTLPENSTKAVATGSVLTVSNLQFQYGEIQ